MKITQKQYGEALYQAVHDKSDSEVKAVLKNFFQILIQNNDLSKADGIIKEFKKIWNKEHGIIEAEVIGAKKLDNKIIELLNDYIIKLSGAKRINLEQKIDKNILGGAVIKYEDKVMDGSLRRRLNELNAEMAK